MRRNPAVAAGSVWSWKDSSLSRSRSKASEPSSPLISRRRAFLRPAAIRVASKEASAPEARLPVKIAASSTVTSPRSTVPAPPESPADAPESRGRSRTKVSETGSLRSPGRACRVPGRGRRRR
ncbi:hypothetical protein SCALM49S_05796 [Streptomyces californicus]